MAFNAQAVTDLVNQLNRAVIAQAPVERQAWGLALNLGSHSYRAMIRAQAGLTNGRWADLTPSGLIAINLVHALLPPTLVARPQDIADAAFAVTPYTAAAAIPTLEEFGNYLALAGTPRIDAAAVVSGVVTLLFAVMKRGSVTRSWTKAKCKVLGDAAAKVEAQQIRLVWELAIGKIEAPSIAWEGLVTDFLAWTNLRFPTVAASMALQVRYSGCTAATTIRRAIDAFPTIDWNAAAITFGEEPAYVLAITALAANAYLGFDTAPAVRGIGIA